MYMEAMYVDDGVTMRYGVAVTPEVVQCFKHWAHSTCWALILALSHVIARLAPLNTRSASADMGGTIKILIANRHR